MWNHFDAENDCPGKCMGVKVVLENGIPGFISIQVILYFFFFENKCSILSGLIDKNNKNTHPT